MVRRMRSPAGPSDRPPPRHFSSSLPPTPTSRLPAHPPARPPTHPSVRPRPRDACRPPRTRTARIGRVPTRQRAAAVQRRAPRGGGRGSNGGSGKPFRRHATRRRRHPAMYSRRRVGSAEEESPAVKSEDIGGGARDGRHLPMRPSVVAPPPTPHATAMRCPQSAAARLTGSHHKAGRLPRIEDASAGRVAGWGRQTGTADGDGSGSVSRSAPEGIGAAATATPRHGPRGWAAAGAEAAASRVATPLQPKAAPPATAGAVGASRRVTVKAAPLRDRARPHCNGKAHRAPTP